MSTELIIAIVAGAALVIGVVLLFVFVPSFRAWVKTKGKAAALMVIREYVLDNVKAVIQREYLVIAQKVQSGELRTKDQIKAELYRLGYQLKERVKAQFSSELPMLGAHADDQIDSLIRWAVDTLSPFPGKETAAAFLEDGLSDMLINRGIDYVQEHLRLGGTGPNPGTTTEGAN